MSSERPAKILILTMCAIGIFHAVALKLYLFVYTWWFDDILHVLAGTVIGYFYFVFRKYFLFLEKYCRPFFLILIFSLVIGIAWEIFEALTYTWGMGGAQSYRLDTTADIFEDLTGAIIAYWVIKKKHYEV